ncbi:MAG: hypothetical protein ACI4C5_05065 [Lachnospiraceae bacterium]
MKSGRSHRRIYQQKEYFHHRYRRRFARAKKDARRDAKDIAKNAEKI